MWWGQEKARLLWPVFGRGVGHAGAPWSVLGGVQGRSCRQGSRRNIAIKPIIAQWFGGVWVGWKLVPVVHVSGGFAGVGAWRAAQCWKTARQGSPLPKSCCSSWAVTGGDGAWPMATTAVSDTSWGAWEQYCSMAGPCLLQLPATLLPQPLQLLSESQRNLSVPEGPAAVLKDHGLSQSSSCPASPQPSLSTCSQVSWLSATVQGNMAGYFLITPCTFGFAVWCHILVHVGGWIIGE